MRIVRHIAFALVLAVAVYLVAAAAGALIPGRTERLPDDGGKIEIALISGPIHYDLLLPATPDTREAFAFAKNAGVPVEHPAVSWIVVGWGAHDFYTTTGTYSDVNAAAVLRGVFGDSAVLRIDVAGPLPAEMRAEKLRLSLAQYRALLDTVLNTRDPGRARALPHDGFTRTDAFFPAQGRFNIFRTCNVWIGEVLRAAGVRFGGWTPTPYAIRLSLWWHGGG
ncbi:MAG: TIGR02117 family protein [Rhodobacteraceae bacterium]|nr:TIGR02117 family protein [Paracoccaceae bacterium]